MAELAVVGNSEFVMGFMLIGIKKIFEGETKSQLERQYKIALKEENIGIIVTNETSLKTLDPLQRRNIENSIYPVVVVLSTNAGGQENLRDMIKKAIGIDLLNK